MKYIKLLFDYFFKHADREPEYFKDLNHQYKNQELQFDAYGNPEYLKH